MPNYGGRFTQQMFTKNFGGIDSKATVLNIGDNEASDITNWDIGLSGAITRRAGTAELAVIGDNANPQAVWWAPFYDVDGIQRFAAIAKDSAGSLHQYDADLVGGTYTNRGDTGMTLTGEDNFKYNSANWQGSVLVANGTDTPIYSKYGEAVQDLKTASRLIDPNSIYCTMVGTTSAATVFYGVTAVTPRGETGMAGTSTSGADVATLTPSLYNLLTWSPVAGASSYRIYWLSPALGSSPDQFRGFDSVNEKKWLRIADVPGNTTSFIDDAPSIAAFYTTTPQQAPANNTAYRTWEDWELNGWPQGFTVVSRGRDERLFAWRGQYVWASGLNDPLSWLLENDSFAFSIDGGMDKQITAIASLYEYILIFTRSQCFVYTGASASDISLQKVIGRGCVSMKSVVNVEGDVYFWSDYGPTSFKRIMSGADISSSTDFNKRIQNKLFEQTNVSEWQRISGYRYIPENRVVWAVPGTEQTKNTIGIVFQFDVNAWSKYDNWNFNHCAVDAAYGVYGLSEVNSSGETSLWSLMTGNTDNGTAITASYKTGWFDMRSWDTRKRLIFTDVVADRTDGNYSFGITWSWDYGIQTSLPITCTQTTTDGCQIETTSSTTTEHRVYADGIGNAFQLEFTSTAKLPCKLIGWRPEIRGKGLRK